MAEITREDAQRISDNLYRLNDTLKSLLQAVNRQASFQQGLTNEQLRSSEVEVDTGLNQPLTNTELRTTPVDVAFATAYNEPDHIELGNSDTVNIPANSVGALSVFLEAGSMDISINGGAAITYSTVGVYSWGATELLDKSFDITTDGSGVVKILIVK